MWEAACCTAIANDKPPKEMAFHAFHLAFLLFPNAISGLGNMVGYGLRALEPDGAAEIARPKTSATVAAEPTVRQSRHGQCVEI